MPGGRPTTCTEDIQEAGWNYARGGWELEGHAVPSVVGLCSVLDTAKSTIYGWAEREDNQFSDMLAHIHSEQELVTFNMSLKGEYNATIAKLLLSKHGYHEKTEVDQRTTVQTVDPLTPAEAKNISTGLDGDY